MNDITWYVIVQDGGLWSFVKFYLSVLYLYIKEQFIPGIKLVFYSPFKPSQVYMNLF